MYAVIRSGGKQYRVAPGQTVRLEKVSLLLRLRPGCFIRVVYSDTPNFPMTSHNEKQDAH